MKHFRNTVQKVQEFRFVLSEQIWAEVFLTAFLRNIENSIKSNAVVKALKQLIQKGSLIYKSCKLVQEL